MGGRVCLVTGHSLCVGNTHDEQGYNLQVLKIKTMAAGCKFEHISGNFSTMGIYTYTKLHTETDHQIVYFCYYSVYDRSKHYPHHLILSLSE
jgi:hypothetical protein